MVLNRKQLTPFLAHGIADAIGIEGNRYEQIACQCCQKEYSSFKTNN